MNNAFMVLSLEFSEAGVANVHVKRVLDNGEELGAIAILSTTDDEPVNGWIDKGVIYSNNRDLDTIEFESESGGHEDYSLSYSYIGEEVYGIYVRKK